MPLSRLRCLHREGSCEIRILIHHPMDNGRMKDPATGERIPPHYIEHLSLHHGKHTLLECTLSTGVAKDPYLTFDYPEGRIGDRITLRWEDNLGQHDEVSTLITASDD